MTNDTTPKQRHGCLTAWLIMMMIGNAFVSLGLLVLDPKLLQEQDPTMTKERMLLLAILGTINFSFAIGLWFWKKWAFYGFALSGFLMFITNINMGVDALSAALGLVGIFLLYSILQMKQGETSGWENLE
jgi:hypothetical protein